MNFEQYQNFFVDHQKNYHFDKTHELSLYALGLAGESGEVIEIIKKYLRDGALSEDALKKELGDVLAYIALLCYYFHFSLEEIAELNIQKNQSRANRNVLQSAGNDR